MSVGQDEIDAVLALSPSDYIRDRRLLKISIVMVALVVAGFMLHGSLGVESSIVALEAAGAILLISGTSIERALSQVEWTTLAFFAGLFIIVGAMTETGVIDMIAHALVSATGGNTFVTMLVLVFA